MKNVNHTLHPKLRRGLLAALGIIFLAVVTVRGDDAKPVEIKDPPPKPKKWESSATVGTTLTRGNSKTFLASGAINTKRTWDHDEVLFGANAGYGESTVTTGATKTDTVTDSYVRGFGQWNHLFSPIVYGGVKATGEHDDIAALAYRATISPLAGYYFVKQTNASLCAEIGPSFIREKFFGEEVHNYLALRIGERGEYKFASGARIWEGLEWFPKIQDFNNFLVNAELGTAAPISKALSVSLVLQDSYKSVPAAGKLKNDLKLIAGLTYSF